MLKILCASCLGLSKAILSQIILKLCVAAKNCEKFTKNPISEVQGYSRSSMLINLKSLSLVLVMISNMHVGLTICIRFYTIRANSGKITFSGSGGTPIWRPRSRETPLPRDTKLSQDELCPWGSQRWRFCDLSLHRFDTVHQCDKQADRRTDIRPGHS